MVSFYRPSNCGIESLRPKSFSTGDSTLNWDLAFMLPFLFHRTWGPCLCLSALDRLRADPSPISLSFPPACCGNRDILGHQPNGLSTLPLVMEARRVLSLAWLNSCFYAGPECICRCVQGPSSVTVTTGAGCHPGLMLTDSLISVLKQRPSQQSSHVWLQLLREQEPAFAGRP